MDWSDDRWAWMFEWDEGCPGEDCLRLNVWTPGLDGSRRPVMVWLHGGAYLSGSSQELKAYDGERLSRRDVVIVSVNHRLGVLGYLDLSEYGTAYRASANIGTLDLVLALEWVRDNIGEFGGDSANVTIFGWSGGAGKVATLLATPAAKGLFHRAILQSGSALRVGSHEGAARLARAILDELGISPPRIDTVQTLPVEALTEAAARAQRRLYGYAAPAPGAGQGFEPVVDGHYLPAHPFEPVAPALASAVPTLFGTVLHEYSHGLIHPTTVLTWQSLRTWIDGRYPGAADEIVSVYRDLHRDASPADVLSLINSVRTSAILPADRQAASSTAGVFMYLFAWRTPLFDGRLGAFHGSDLPFVFDNTDRCENLTGGGHCARRLADKVGEAWVRFARFGDPNHSGLGTWPAYTVSERTTMIFDRRPAARRDPDRVERECLTRAATRVGHVHRCP